MIRVIDSVMGSGKTKYMIKKMSKLVAPYDNTNIIYVTPFLTEVDRIIRECDDVKFQQPSDVTHRSKTHSLLALIRSDANIVMSHSLFSLITQEIAHEISLRRYVLVLDEVMECVSEFKGITTSDLNMLRDTGYLLTDPVSRRLLWSKGQGEIYKGKHEAVMRMVNNGKLALYGEDTVIQEFPAEFLSVFREVYVLTYLFDGSPMSAYLAKHGYTYELLTLNKHEVVSWSDHSDEAELKELLRSRLKIYEGSKNDIGTKVDRKNPLSLSWYERQAKSHPDSLAKLKASTEDFFKKTAKTQALYNAWTVFSDFQSKTKGQRYTKGFIPFNCRATNHYIEKRSLAYLCNVFPRPVISQYLDGKGIKFNKDLYALSEMLQWIWRSQIRRHDPIHLFIPSERMRNLLYLWLNTRSTPELISKLS